MLHTLSSMLPLLLSANINWNGHGMHVDATHAPKVYADVDDEITPEFEAEFESQAQAQAPPPLPLRYLLRTRNQRTLLAAGSGQVLLLFVQTPFADHQQPIEVPFDGTVADIIRAIGIRGAVVSFGGKMLDAGLDLAEAGLGMEAVVEVTPPPTDCMRLTLAFDNTNVFDKMGWPHIKTHAEEQTCCRHRGVTCQDPDDAQTPKIKEIDLFNQGLTGRIEWSHLPQSLEWLDLRDNQFEGEVAWQELQRLQSLKSLYLDGNQFEGAVAWQELPQSLERLHLRGNQFVGELAWQELQHLPQSLEWLSLRGNQFVVSAEAKAEAESKLKARGQQIRIWW